MNSFQKFIIRNKFGLKERISLYERLAAFLSSGIPAYDSVVTIKNRYERNKDSRSLMFAEWANEIKRGANMSDAMKPWIPTSEYMLISAGEMGAGIEVGLAESTRMSLATSKMRKAIIGGIIMPVVLLIMMYFMLWMFKTKMAPTFITLLPVEKWSSSAQLLFNISTFMVNYVIYILIFMGIMGFIIAKSLPRWVSPLRDKIFDNIPPYTIYKSSQASSFLIGLSSMLQSGIALNESLTRIRNNSSPWTASHIEKMLASMKTVGDKYGDALNTGLFDAETSGDIEDYSKLSSFEKAIYRIGARMVETGVESTEAKMAVVKNLMLVLVAVSVGWIYGTAYDLQSTIAESMQTR